MKKHIIYLFALCLVLMNACQKEISLETGSSLSAGSLQSDVSGDCLPKTVNGSYVAGTALAPTVNTITVQVNVTKTGSYLVKTDTINGYYFRATGTFSTTGTNTVTLKSSGIPLAAGTNNFVISYDTTTCSVPVIVLPSGSGGAAVFTLTSTGSPASCTAVVNGSYAIGTVLTPSNTVSLSVNVTTIGTYTITTTFQGMTFSKTGSFTATGVQNVLLNGSGTPTTGGANNVPVTAGASSCSFVVNVGSPAVGTLGGGPAPGTCTPSTVNGTYSVGTALTASNTVQVQVVVTTPGVYSITTNTVNGISFSASGTFAATGIQNVILNGTGTPAAVGTFNATVTFGASSCSFPVTCVTGLSTDYFPRTTNSNWSYEFDNNTNDSLLRKVSPASLTVFSNTYNIFAATNDISLGFDSSGYYRKSGGDYFEYFDVGAFIGYDNPQWVEYVMLKDNVAAGTNWKSAGYAGTITSAPNPPQSLTLRFSYTILQKDVPISITTSTGIANYINVIVVEEKYEQFTGGVWVDITSLIDYYGKSYYARGIGLIKYEAYNAAGAVTSQQELRRYQVF